MSATTESSRPATPPFADFRRRCSDYLTLGTDGSGRECGAHVKSRRPHWPLPAQPILGLLSSSPSVCLTAAVHTTSLSAHDPMATPIPIPMIGTGSYISHTLATSPHLYCTAPTPPRPPDPASWRRPLIPFPLPPIALPCCPFVVSPQRHTTQLAPRTAPSLVDASIHALRWQAWLGPICLLYLSRNRQLRTQQTRALAPTRRAVAARAPPLTDEPGSRVGGGGA
ncbi:uncharacterized protein J3D65DRAFT_238993 [Phyllosticta citribraziliensis]|uniref:Uncharacterized protein n=1 Tax=Phyllosticta citribraziliensis TaxID=989973 RepID=A0ABR1M0M3_9PEZI